MSDGDPQPPSLKRQKPSDRQPDEFSNAVRRRLEKSSRTGQACDRCKVRKIRCDATPGGCTPCRQNNTECKTIDRITGKATIRGHHDRLEDENRLLRQKCDEYSTQLKDLGVEVAPIQFPPLYPPQPAQNWAASPAPWADSLHPGQPPLAAYNTPGASLSLSQALPSFRGSAPGDSYLGVGSSNSLLSTITGTSLQIFGMKIDVADYAPNDTDDISSPASYDFFLAAILKKLPQSGEEVQLPHKLEDMKQYADWYFRSLNPYTPVVLRPQVMDIIERTYSDANFAPSAAQRVWMHMVLAQIKFQFGQRNKQPSSVDDAHAHMRYSLGFYYDMLQSHKLEDLQALALICIHLRNFTKPGAAWIVTRRTLDMALELGLHRSAKAWGADVQVDPAEAETRKRVFWTLYGLHVHLSGKLGRPMPLRLEDIDTEFPEVVSDSLPGEPATCSFVVGVHVCKMTALLSQMYSSVYTIRRDPSLHEATVRRLEELLEKWRSELPPELSDPATCEGEQKVCALYVMFFDAEFQLLLHHPAVCLSSNPAFVEWNSNICLMAATKMLQVLEQIMAFNCLDLPWINLTVYLSGIFTTLFVQSQRQEHISLIEMEKLRKDMSIWLDIMGELGRILGSGNRLRESIRLIIDQALGAIAHRLNVQKPQAAAAGQVDPTAAMVAAAIATEANRVSQEQASVAGTTHDGLGGAVFPSYGEHSTQNEVKQRLSGEFLPSDDANQEGIYPTTSGAGYSYPDPSGASLPGYGNAGNPAGSAASAANAFAAEQGYVPASDEQGTQRTPSVPLAAAPPQQTTSEYGLYATAAPPHNPQQQVPHHNQQTAAANAVIYNIGSGIDAIPHTQTDWMRWSAQALGQPLPGNGEYLSGANTLMTLRGNEGSSGTTATGVEASHAPVHAQWPVMMFNANASSGMGPQPDIPDN